MNNRANLYTQSEKENRVLVLEAFYNVPFFWILLLDTNIIKQQKDNFIQQSNDNYIDIEIDKKAFSKNTSSALSYLKAHYPKHVDRFQVFINYLHKIFSEKIIININEKKFRHISDLLNELEKTHSTINESIVFTRQYHSKYLEDSFITIAGFDGHINVGHTFSDFCPEYKIEVIAAIKEQTTYELEKQRNLDAKNKKQKKMNKVFIFASISFFLLWLYQYINTAGSDFNKRLETIFWLIPFIWWVSCKEAITGKGWFPKKHKKTKKTITHKAQKSEEEVINELPELNNEIKEGYKEIITLCCTKTTQDQLKPFFDELKDFSDDEEYYTTLNYVMDHLHDNWHFIIMSLDWKQDLETLEWYIENALKNNFGLEANLPSEDQFEDNISVYHDNVFEEYDKPLRDINFQMGFIDTNSDEYVILIHKTEDKEKVEKAVNKIEYPYFEINHFDKLKIIKPTT